MFVPVSFFSLSHQSNALNFDADGAIYQVMRIAALERYRRNRIGYFQDLTPTLRASAYRWLDRFCKRWRGDLPAWRLAILVGQARRLALNPPTSAWGKRMLAKRGGLAVQRKYRLEGRHPTERATRRRLQKLATKKREEAEATERASLGLPPADRVYWLPLD